MKSRLATRVLTFLGLWLSANVGFTHELEPGAPANASQPAAKWNPDRLTYMPVDRVPQSSISSPSLSGLEYIVVLPNRWAQGQDIHVCFQGGSGELRAKILQLASTWINLTNLHLVAGGPSGVTCADKDKSHVRIGFSEPGYWSYIGHDSIADALVSKNLPSMNFEGFDTYPPAEPRFTGIILHEWGHALGLHHEHQSPADGCDAEYDWPKLYAYYKNNYGWDQTMVDQNVRQLNADRSAYDWSTPDPDSIMIYGSNPQFLIHGTASKCYFHDNNSLSKLDIVGIQKTYTQAGAVAALKVQNATLPIALSLPIDQNLRTALERQRSLVDTQMSISVK
jgi:hypothetical protein